MKVWGPGIVMARVRGLPAFALPILRRIADLEATASKFPDSKKRKRGATSPESDGSVDDNNSQDSDNSSD